MPWAGLPLVAEDLGVITEGVNALRDRFQLPGMRVLQFGLEGTPGTEFHLPYSYVPHCVAYTGTHDNDTTVGWFSRPPGRDARRAGLPPRPSGRTPGSWWGPTGDEVHWDVIRAALGSVADTVIIPMQDLLGLGDASRMNVPGQPKGNWAWRLPPGQLDPRTRDRLAELTALSGRWNGTVPDRFAPPRLPAAEAPPLIEPAPAVFSDLAVY